MPHICILKHYLTVLLLKLLLLSMHTMATTTCSEQQN